MDSVPFSFCDAVVSSFKCPTVLNPCQLDSTEFHNWKAAFQDHNAKRTPLSLFVHCVDGVWSYKFTINVVSLKFNEVLKMQRKFLIIDSVFIGLEHHGFGASFEEIRQVFKLAFSLAYGSKLHINNIDANDVQMAQLLSSAQIASFYRIVLLKYKDAYEQFIRDQINRGNMKIFHLFDRCPAALALEAEFKGDKVKKI